MHNRKFVPNFPVFLPSCCSPLFTEKWGQRIGLPWYSRFLLSNERRPSVVTPLARRDTESLMGTRDEVMTRLSINDLHDCILSHTKGKTHFNHQVLWDLKDATIPAEPHNLLGITNPDSCVSFHWLQSLILFMRFCRFTYGRDAI